MKNILIGIFLILMITSCVKQEDDLNQKGFNYTVIDTTHISRNGFDTITGYDVIVEQDSALYSAFMYNNGVIMNLDRKLKVRK